MKTESENFTFFLNQSRGIPVYLQLVHQVKHALQLGYLKPGDQLPTVKQVVSSVVVNPNTVLKAYRILEAEGLVDIRPGSGTFLTGSEGGLNLGNLDQIQASLREWFQKAIQAGLDQSAIDAIFSRVMRECIEESIL